jgi:hypothetical protein
MLNTSGLLYLSAHVISTVENFFASRNSHYVLIFASSLIACCFGAPWSRFAYFASGGKRVAEQNHVPPPSKARSTTARLTGILLRTLRDARTAMYE